MDEQGLNPKMFREGDSVVHERKSVIITHEVFHALSRQVQLMAAEMERMSARQQAQGEIIKSMAAKHNSLAGAAETMAKMNAELLEKLHDKMEGLDKPS
jgi:hypothetical protein